MGAFSLIVVINLLNRLKMVIKRLEDVVGSSKSVNLSTEVKKPIEIEVDVGNLLAFDQNPLPTNITSLQEAERDNLFMSLARDCTQVIVNKLWQCEKVNDTHSVVALLPLPKVAIPREKPIPKARPLTKWEQFAKDKGIKKKSKNTKVWDEKTKSWKFSWGYRKKIGEKEEKDYAANLQREMDEEQNRFKEPSSKDKKAPVVKKHLTKGERVAKNELNRLRNIARARKTSGIDSGGVLPAPTLNDKYIPLKSESRKALDVATTSTASLGRFTDPLKDDPHKGRKRKMVQIKEKNKQSTAEFSSESNKKEKAEMLRVFENIQNKKESFDSKTAAKAFAQRKDEKQKDEEILGKKSLSKTAKKKRDGAKAHANRVPLAQLKKGMKKKTYTGKSGSGSTGGIKKGGSGGKVTKKKGKK